MFETFIAIIFLTATWGFIKLASIIQDVEVVETQFDKLQSVAVQLFRVLFMLMGVMTILGGFIIAPHLIDLSIQTQIDPSNINATTLAIVDDLIEGYEIGTWLTFQTFALVNGILMLAVIFFVYTKIGQKVFNMKKPGIKGTPKLK